MVPYSHYLKSMIIVSIVVVLTDAMLVSVIMGVSAHILRREATLGRRLVCYFKALRIFLLDSSLFSTYQTPLQNLMATRIHNTITSYKRQYQA
jgi:hypothetical protein